MFFGGLVAGFFLGAAVSACMTEGARRAGFRSKYILPMALQAVLLSVMTVTLDYYTAYGTPFTFYFLTHIASFAMGLQNATITRVSGAVVRTTHLTGVVTDMGLEGVQYLLWAWDKTRARRPGAVQKLRAARRDLVVCGVNRSQFKAMRDAGTADVLGMENFCPDLDIALARAMNRVHELLGATQESQAAPPPVRTAPAH